MARKYWAGECVLWLRSAGYPATGGLGRSAAAVRLGADRDLRFLPSTATSRNEELTMTFYELDKIPSHNINIIKMLPNAIVTRMVRCSSCSPDILKSEYRDNFNEPYPQPDSMIFSMTSGPVCIWLDSGIVIGVGSQPSLYSVTLWVERDQNGILSDDPCENDDDLFPIEASDERYSMDTIRQLIGQKIEKVSILKREADDPRLMGRPMEVGVVIYFENGTDLVLSHGLHNNSDDFSVINKNQIIPSIIPLLHEITVGAKSNEQR